MVHVLVRGEAGTIGGNLKQYPTRLAEVDRVEIEAVDDRSDAQACPRQPFPPSGMLLVVGGAEGYMMDPAGSRLAAEGKVGPLHQPDFGPRTTGTNLKRGGPMAVFLILTHL